MPSMADTVAFAIKSRAMERGHSVHDAVAKHLAVAAIEAMRDPTEAMEQAYYAACDVNGMCLWKHGYRVMIDAALKGD